MDYKIERCANDEESEFIDESLYQFNLATVPVREDAQTYAVHRKAVDAEGKIIGGCLGLGIAWDFGYIDVLWVDEAYRGQGIGSALLAEVESVLKREGCNLVYLDTFDWQAKDFYLKQGYTVFGTLDDCPKGHCKYFMKKVF